MTDAEKVSKLIGALDEPTLVAWLNTYKKATTIGRRVHALIKEIGAKAGFTVEPYLQDKLPALDAETLQKWYNLYNVQSTVGRRLRALIMRAAMLNEWPLDTTVEAKKEAKKDSATEETE